jgi:hypothetical protein
MWPLTSVDFPDLRVRIRSPESLAQTKSTIVTVRAPWIEPIDFVLRSGRNNLMAKDSEEGIWEMIRVQDTLHGIPANFGRGRRIQLMGSIG